MSEKPFNECPSCGTPQLDDAPLALVLYFKTEEGRDEFIEVFKEVYPNAGTYSIGSINEHGDSK